MLTVLLQRDDDMHARTGGKKNRSHGDVGNIFSAWYDDGVEVGHFSAKTYGLFIIYQQPSRK